MVAAPIPFELVEAKLAAPLARAGTVAKAGLIERLSTATLPFVTVILAPAGYGKTTLLARWAEADPRPFAWVALDGRDDDPLVLLRYVAAAIHRVTPLSSDVFDALSGPGGSGWATRVRRVGGALGAIERSVVLVLDDLHVLGNPSCLDVLTALFEYVPPGSQIAVATRNQPGLPLGRWRTQGWVHEVGVADLRLDEQEAASLLQAAGVVLPAGEMAELVERTEGWPAGLYLAALARRAGGGASAGVAGLVGDDGLVAEYFRDELLSRLPEAEARFLTRSSVLERMSGDLCDAVLETTGSAAVLEALERRNYFVVPLDRRARWYRYHHLFGRLLQDELARGEPELIPELNRRAMAWCLTRALPEAAVRYGQVAGETETVAGLVEAIGPQTHYDGRTGTLDAWLGWFSDEDLRSHPTLAVLGAWVRVLTGRPDDAERWLALTEGTTSVAPLPDGSATIDPSAAVLRANMMRHGVERALADAELAVDQLPPESAWIPDALTIRGVLRILAGADADAARDLEAAAERAADIGAVDIVIAAQAELAILAARHGDWGEAGRRARAAQAHMDQTGFDRGPIGHVATARVALHEGRYDDVRVALTRAHRLRPLLDHGLPWRSVQVGLELVRVHLALGEAATARIVLSETERVLELRPDLGSLVEDVREARARVAATTGPAGAWAMSLTGAEIRLLPYLATHLSFPEIATRLALSRNTIKTEAVSIYRKLGASSRSEAIERAVEVGLMDASIYPARASLRADA